METRDILVLSVLLTQAAKSTAVHLPWYYFPPLAFEDDNGELKGIFATLAVDIDRLCFDGNPVYAAYNNTIAFEERLIDGGSFVAGPVSRGVNSCTRWPSGQYFLPVLESNGPTVLKSATRTSNVIVQFLSACWALPFILLATAGIAGCLMWILDHFQNQSDFPSSVCLGVWDGFWWAIVSASTVGYGDKAPCSVPGRLWGVVWILMGINLMSFLFTLMASALRAELDVASSIRGIQTAVVNGSEEHLTSLLEGADVTVVDSYPELFQDKIFSLVDAVVVDTYHLLSLTPDNTRGMEIAARLSHATVHGLLLSNITGGHVDCALDRVQKKRIDILTAMHSQLNVLESEIGRAAASASNKLFGSSDIVLYILLGVLVGLMLIMKLCEMLYYRTTRTKVLEKGDDTVKQANNLERHESGLKEEKDTEHNTTKTEKL